MRKTRAKAKKAAGIRIIGGRWRGRRLPVADVPGLRPTGDRLRETLFNWLQPSIHNAHCLDLFAGTGALGFEAVSRGAGPTVLVEQNAAAIRGLERSQTMLAADSVEICRADAVQLCSRPPAFSCAPFNLVFIDPPWSESSQQQIMQSLVENAWLAEDALIYIEMPVRQEFSPSLQLHEIKRKTAGEAMTLLFCYKKI